VKVRVEGDWRGEGFEESLEPEEQDSGRKLVLPENAYNLSGSFLTFFTIYYLLFLNFKFYKLDTVDTDKL